MQSGAKNKHETQNQYLLWNAKHWPHVVLATHRGEQALKEWQRHGTADSLPSDELMKSNIVHGREKKKKKKTKQC